MRRLGIGKQNSLYVRRVINTTYAVQTVPTACQPQKPDSPAAAWYFFIFSTKNVHKVNIFCGKDLVSSALPEPALSVVEWGDIPHQTREHLIHGSIGRFAVFAHVVVFVVQTPTV